MKLSKFGSLPPRLSTRARHESLMPGKRNVVRAALWLALPLTFQMACSQADVRDTDDGSPLYTDLPVAADEGTELGGQAAGNEELLPNENPRGSLDPARRQQLSLEAEDLIQRLATGPNRALEEAETTSPSGDEDPPSSEDTQPETLSDARAMWDQFLDSVRENGNGGFMVEDVMFSTEASLLKYFELLYSTRIDKSYVGASHAWPETCDGIVCEPPLLRVCWSTDSNATNFEKQTLVDLVQGTWGSLSLLTFSFTDAGGNFRACPEGQDGLFKFHDGDEEIALYQTTSLPAGSLGGCSKLGTDHLNGSSAGPCSPGSGGFHDYATIKVPASTAYASTIVHEFGHAIGLLHEHTRDELVVDASTCSSIVTSRTNEQPLYISQGCTGGNCINDVEVGAYDPFSVMHYCTPGQGVVTLGDMLGARAFYFGRSYGVSFRHSSWYPASVRLNLDASQFTVSATKTKTTFVTGANRVVANNITVSAQSLNDARLRCGVTVPGRYVRGAPSAVPPGGLASNPLLATCYHAALLPSMTSLPLL